MTGYHAGPPGRNSELAHLLRKLIARLASPHDGEVIATTRAISRVLKAAGFDLNDLAEAAAAGISDRTQNMSAQPDRDWAGLARWCRDSEAGQLTERERAFVVNMVAWC